MTDYRFVEFEADADLAHLADLARRQIAGRAGPFVVHHHTGERMPLMVELVVDGAMPAEAFDITDAGEHAIRIAGGGRRGVLFGIGRFLREARYATGAFTPGDWRGRDAPVHPVRGMYFASHAGNWYVNAPPRDVVRYLEDLTLWGFNAIAYWFCMADYDSADDPAAVRDAQRFRLLTDAAHALDLDVYVIAMANEPFGRTPDALRARCESENGYTRKPLAWFPNQICPSVPDGMDLILEHRKRMLALFDGVTFDGVVLWPYDQGGCTCAPCAPWGGNGFLKSAPPVIDLFQTHSPVAKIVISTWEMDKFTIGEYDAVDRAIRDETFGKVDAVMADNHHGQPVPWIAEHGVPGSKPLLGFPEISMWGIEPWGGYGAIANPASLQSMWDNIRDRSDGGFPYSEGLFEDVNKAICAGFYWNDAPAAQSVRDYAALHFGHDVADDAADLVHLLERSFPRQIIGKQLPLRYRLDHPDRAVEAWRLAVDLAARLTAPIRRTWRWRMIFLRCLVDAELAEHDGHVSETCENALNELTELYCYGAGSNYCMDPQRIVRHGKPMDRRL